MVTRALLAPGSRHLVARFRANAAKRTIALDTLPKVMRLCFPGVRWEYKTQDGYVLFPDIGSEIWIGGLDSPERIDKILGAEFATIFVNEASEVPWGTIEVLKTRLAQNALITMGPNAGRYLRHKFYIDLNPTGKKHWSYRLFVDKVNPGDGAPLAEPHDYVWMQINPVDNPNLSPAYLKALTGLSKLQKKRFYDGDYNGETEGALWSEPLFRRCSRTAMAPLQRIVIAVDPSGAKHAKDISADEIGIIVAGLGSDGVIYVLEDLSLRASPAIWAKLIVAAYQRLNADAVIVEDNFGGPLVESMIRAVDAHVNVRSVAASSGKHIRAEPVAALYERGLVRHVGEADQYEALEDQLMQFTVAGYMGAGSPDRADALVWAGTALLINPTIGRASGVNAFDLASRRPR
jgi:hypothetical protein